MFELGMLKSFKRPRPESDDEEGHEVYFKRQRIKTAKRKKTMDEKPILTCPHCDREFRYDKPYEKHLKEHKGDDWRDDSNHNDAVIDEIEHLPIVIPVVLIDPHEEAAAAAAALLELDKDDDLLRDDYYDYFGQHDWAEETSENIESLEAQASKSEDTVVDKSAFETAAVEVDATTAIVDDSERESESLVPSAPDGVADEQERGDKREDRDESEHDPETEQLEHEESVPAEQPNTSADPNKVVEALRTTKRKSRRITKETSEVNVTSSTEDENHVDEPESLPLAPTTSDSSPSVEPEKKKKRRRSIKRTEKRDEEKHDSTHPEHPFVDDPPSTDATEKRKKRKGSSKRCVQDTSEAEPAGDEATPVAPEEVDELTIPTESNPPSVPTTKSERKRRKSRKRTEESSETELEVASIDKPKKANRKSREIDEDADFVSNTAEAAGNDSEKTSTDEISNKRRSNRRSARSIEDGAPPSASQVKPKVAADEPVAVQPTAPAADAADSVELSEKSKRKSRRRTEQADPAADEAASVALKGAASDPVEQLDQLEKKGHRKRTEETPSPIEAVTADRSVIAAADESNKGTRKIRRSIKKSDLAKVVTAAEQTNEQQDLMEPEQILSDEAKSSKDLRKRRRRKNMKDASETTSASATVTVALHQAPTKLAQIHTGAAVTDAAEKSEQKRRKASKSKNSAAEIEADESIVESEYCAEKVDATDVKPTFTCAVCERIFKYEGNYKKHFLAHEEDMEVDKSTANEAKQNDGKAECDGNVDNNSEAKPTFTCSSCERTFKYEGSYKKHLLAHEEETEVDKEISAEDDDIGIETDKSNEEDISEEKSTLACAVCEREFVFEGNYKKHMLMHEEEDVQDVKPESLQDTISPVAPSKELSCPVCDRKYKYEGHYKRHLLAHEEEEEEDKKIETDASSYSDAATSRKEEPALPSKTFKCPSCVRTFKYEGHYKRHLHMHELSEAASMDTSADEMHDDSLEAAPPSDNTVAPAAVLEAKKSFSCSTCQRRYDDEWRYKKHMVAHATAMDISDDEDNSISDRKSEKDAERSERQRKRIAEKPLLTCPICEQSYKYDVCYKKHMKTHGDETHLTEVSTAVQPLVIITSSMLKWRISEEIVNNFRVNVDRDVAANCVVSSVVESAEELAVAAVAAIKFIVDAIEVEERAASLARLPSSRQHRCLSPCRDVLLNVKDREITEGLWSDSSSLSQNSANFHTNSLAAAKDQRPGADSTTNDKKTRNLDDDVVRSSTGDVCTLRTGLKLTRPDRLVFTGSKYCPAPAISTWAWSRSQ
ncbi:hypothetical protein PRIPAC_89509 [Pristionchus pacificus]|uniref:Zinc finger protein n=1 Tax=Pristionchus pacificus TaxID=54126 RepID=A0A2A6B9J2_PRIPA|nr:hypothetical protein PRIPAC_89509 [Pristionchus pacificus]|eukprot:PDM62533.1 zinc finger protein [Pristionchus pacificus]